MCRRRSLWQLFVRQTGKVNAEGLEADCDSPWKAAPGASPPRTFSIMAPISCAGNGATVSAAVQACSFGSLNM